MFGLEGPCLSLQYLQLPFGYTKLQFGLKENSSLTFYRLFSSSQAQTARNKISSSIFPTPPMD
jgi:hypothetical protein